MVESPAVLGVIPKAKYKWTYITEYPPTPPCVYGHSGKPLFEICWVYMGIAKIAVDPLPPNVGLGDIHFS